jgi:hypothetical protein
VPPDPLQENWEGDARVFAHGVFVTPAAVKVNVQTAPWGRNPVAVARLPQAGTGRKPPLTKHQKAAEIQWIFAVWSQQAHSQIEKQMLTGLNDWGSCAQAGMVR